MATVTRDQFDPTKRVQKKIFQKGSFVVDADLNEQVDVALENRRRSLSCLCNHADARFDDGFSVAGHVDDLKVTIKAGNAAFHLTDELAVLLTLDADYTLSGFSSWVSSGQRTDLVYIDIEEVEYSASTDITIINPTIGEETCRDIRASFTFKIANNTTTLPTEPAGHVYRALATITKDGTVNLIDDSEIVSLLPHFRGSSLETMEVPLWMLDSISLAGQDAQALTNSTLRFYAEGTGDTEIERRVVKFPYVYDPAHRYLALHAEVWRDLNCKASIELEGFSFGGFPVEISAVEATALTAYLDPAMSSPTPGAFYDIQINLKITGSAKKVYMRRPFVVAGLGSYSRT